MSYLKTKHNESFIAGYPKNDSQSKTSDIKIMFQSKRNGIGKEGKYKQDGKGKSRRYI